jgi:protein-disulfide isomerase
MRHLERHNVNAGGNRQLFLSLLLLTGILLFSSTLLHAENARYNVPIGDSPVLGPSDAPVTIIEFLDYQ